MGSPELFGDAVAPSVNHDHDVTANCYEDISMRHQQNELGSGLANTFSCTCASNSLKSVDRVAPRSDDNDHHRREMYRQARRFLGIRWAPLFIPFQRRLQTLAVGVHCIVFFVAPLITVSVCTKRWLWWAVLPYFCYVCFSNAADTDSTWWRWEWFRNSAWWKWFADYFPAELHKTADLPADRRYIFGYHPHGIIGHGAFAALATEGCNFGLKFPGITNSLLTLDYLFKVPIFREYLLLTGVRSVSEKSICNFLTAGGLDGRGQGRAVTIVLGGARESLEAHPGTMRLVLKGRFGFIKCAVRIGADIVPILNFGENDLYDDFRAVQQLSVVRKIQSYLLQACKFTIPMFKGRGALNYDFGIIPHRHPMHVVVGEPISVKQSDDPDEGEVRRLHAVYCNQLQHIWDTYKDQYAPHRKAELEFI